MQLVFYIPLLLHLFLISSGALAAETSSAFNHSKITECKQTIEAINSAIVAYGQMMCELQRTPPKSNKTSREQERLVKTLNTLNKTIMTLELKKFSWELELTALEKQAKKTPSTECPKDLPLSPFTKEKQ
ncbi:MAG: hypothetical protein WCE21_01770 [Candidatus Babeliales bacterium]